MSNPPPAPQHVVLVGLRGAGKTTIGRAMAGRLRRPFHDLDDLVLRRLEVVSVREVFERLGEAPWRAGELAALSAFLDAPLASSILALGGGAVMVEPIARLLQRARSEGRITTVLLDVPPAVAAERLRRDPGDRTSITGRGLIEELAELHARRIGRYRELADITIDVGAGDPDAIARVLAP